MVMALESISNHFERMLSLSGAVDLEVVDIELVLDFTEKPSLCLLAVPLLDRTQRADVDDTETLRSTKCVFETAHSVIHRECDWIRIDIAPVTGLRGRNIEHGPCAECSRGSYLQKRKDVVNVLILVPL